MINSKQDLKEYLEADKLALGINRKRPRFFSDEVWRYQIYLRKAEYYNNLKRKGLFSLLGYFFYKGLYHKWSVKLGFSIPLNVFDKGLSIAHYGTIVVNGMAKIGKNCRIQEGVTIGATGGNSKAPIIGDNVFIGSGAKLIGDICIGNNVAIGAGAVVVKSFPEDNLTLAGVPAKIISNNGAEAFIRGQLIQHNKHLQKAL